MDEQDFTLGVDLACSGAHVATLADAAADTVAKSTMAKWSLTLGEISGCA